MGEDVLMEKRIIKAVDNVIVMHLYAKISFFSTVYDI